MEEMHVKRVLGAMKCGLHYHNTRKYPGHEWWQKAQTLGTTNLNQYTSSTKKEKNEWGRKKQHS